MIRRLALLSWPLLVFSIGCGSPSAANIALRKELQDRDGQIAELNRQHAADQADLAAGRGPTTTSLSAEKIDQLYTTHGLKFGRLTGGAQFSSGGAAEDGLKIQIVPIDEDGQALKAAGTFDVSAFDLQDNGEAIDVWHFDEAAARSHWYGTALLYGYVLPCPWRSKRPAHAELTVQVSFTDALTGRKFTAQQQVRVSVAPAGSMPSTRSETAP